MPLSLNVGLMAVHAPAHSNQATVHPARSVEPPGTTIGTSQDPGASYPKILCHNGSMWMWLIVGCWGLASFDGGEAEIGDTGSSPGTGPEVGVESVGAMDDPSAWLYGIDRVVEITLVLQLDSWQSLERDPYTKVAAAIEVDGQRMDDIAVRLKGRYGSYRPLSQKSGFLVDINYLKPDQELFGLEQLNLNNMVQDSAQIHDFMAYEVYRLLDIPCPRVGFAWLTVRRENGGEVVGEEVFGLYANVEAYDDVFLDRNFEDGSGRLYDGDYWLADDWSWYTFADFTPDLQGTFELDEGEDVGAVDIAQVTDTLGDVVWTSVFWPAMDKIVDMDQFTRLWAAEAWVGQYDGYAYNRNNYRVYFDPSDAGRATIMPWDHDWAFYSDTPLASPTGHLAQGCNANTACAEAFLEHLWSLSPAVEAADIRGRMNAVIELTEPYNMEDPRKEVSMATIQASRRALHGWLTGRDATLERSFER
jgi:hypothetical protein